MSATTPLLEHHVSPTCISIPPRPPPPSPNPAYHIFFIPGNPGLISYYHTFLSSLSEASHALRAGVGVYGHSGANFDPFTSGDSSAPTPPAPPAPPAPLGLQGQIGFFEELLREYVRGVRQEEEGEKEVRVLLVGHSVGAYMALEVLRRVQERWKQEGKGIRVVGVVGLWPTVTHIARSTSGVRMGWLLKLSHFALIISILAHALTYFVSEGALSRLLQLAMGFPVDAARTTAQCIKSPMGVRQALHMAKDEINEITEDRWDEDIWGAATESESPRPKLIFYFGKRDHWVADHTRDELIAVRAYRDGGEEWKPRMLIDEEGIPHSFPIKHGGPVAKIVAGFVDEIIKADKS